MIAIDWTLGAAALIFLVTLIGLNRLLFRPLFQVLEQRRAATTDVFEKAEGGAELFESKVSEVENRLKSERQAGYQQAELVRNQSLTQKQSRIQDTRARADSLVAEARQRLDDEIKQAREQLELQAQEIAQTISERVLSR